MALIRTLRRVLPRRCRRRRHHLRRRRRALRRAGAGTPPSKAALEHLTLTLAAEDPGILGYAVDPGDMRTQMHQDALPGEDISDRPLPETVASRHLLALLDAGPPAGATGRRICAAGRRRPAA